MIARQSGQKTLLGAIVLGLLMVLLSVVFRYVEKPRADKTTFINSFYSWALEQGKRVVFDRSLIAQTPEELLDPWASEPQWDQILYFEEELKALAQCKGMPAGKSTMQKKAALGQYFSAVKIERFELQRSKLELEFRLRCAARGEERAESLPESLWTKPPFVHPLGGSWARRLQAYEARAEGKKTKLDPRFFTIEERYAELTHPRSIEIFLQDLTLIPINKTEMLVHQQGLLRESIYRKITMPQVKQFANERGFDFSDDPDLRCLHPNVAFCFSVRPTFIDSIRPYLGSVGFALILGAIGLLSFFNWRRQQQVADHQKISALAISHELRHPISVMHLILERWRSYFDEIPDHLQDDVFRLMAELRRLLLLAKASESFLRSIEGEQPKWQLQTIESLSSWGRQLAEGFGIEFEAKLMQSEAFTTDPYWLGVAIENLVKNALTHGRPPVRLEFKLKLRRLQVQVFDQGLEFAALNSTKGLGLGLQVAQKIIKAMGGKKIVFESSPKRVSFFVEELKS